MTEKTIELPGIISVRDLAERIECSPIDIIKALMQNGVMANINQQVDFDTAAIVASELGYEATLEMIEQVEDGGTGEIALWRRLIANEDEKSLKVRPPVITVLGHVDHGKTSLLDAIRSTAVQEGEVGGITQHISAYQVTHDERLITFLDTPGHAAFTAMRSRGAQGADIVILVVAADDGVMPQTKEAYSHAKAAQVPIIVALNKMDKDNANPELVKKQLADIGLIPDDWDGDTIIVPVSAKAKTGLEDLLEAILLVADDTEILANPEGQEFGTVIEAKRNRAKGVETTILVQNGTVNIGDVLIAGTTYGRVKAITDYYGKSSTSAGPSKPVSVMGFGDVPVAGDLFRSVKSDKEARLIVADRIEKQKAAAQAKSTKITLENLFDHVQAGNVRELRLIIKADVQGSLEPIVSSLQGMSATDDEGKIKVTVVHSGTGNISESDVMLAGTSGAIVLGFNVKPDSAAQNIAEKEHVSIRYYDIIYRLIEDVEKSLKGMLQPEEREVVLGKAEVRAIFKVRKLGSIAGCRVIDGEIRRNAKVRVMRGKEEIFAGEIGSLKHEKDDVREVRKGFECGIGVKNFSDFEENDIIECFTIEMVSAEL